MKFLDNINVAQIVERFIPAPFKPYWEQRGTSPIGYRLVRGGFWSMMGTGISQTLNLIIIIVVARMLGKESYGEYGIIMNTLAVFNVFTVYGLGMTATKHVAEFKNSDPARAGRIMALFSLMAVGTALLMSFILLIVSSWLAQTILAAPHLAFLLSISAGYLFFCAFNSVQTGILSGLEAFRAIAWINTVSSMLLFLSLGIGVYFFGLTGAVGAMVISMAITCVISNIELRKEAGNAGISFIFSECSKEIKILVKFSLPAVLAAMMYTPANWLCVTMLVNQHGGYGEMGIFSAASSWQKAILFLPQCLQTISLPMLSDFHGTKERRLYRKAFWYNIVLITGSAGAAAAMIALASPFIMKLYGAGFSSGTYVLVIISFVAVLTSIDYFISVVIMTQWNMWFIFVSNALWAMILITAAYFMIPTRGALGLSMAMLLAYVAQTLLHILAARKIIQGSAPFEGQSGKDINSKVQP